MAYVRDGLANILTGRGTSVDRRSGNAWWFVPKTCDEISSAYRANWLVKKAINAPAQDMVREWRDWQAENADIEKLEAEEKRLRVREHILQGLVYGRMGGGIVLIGLENQDPAMPAQPGRVMYLKALSRWSVTLGGEDTDPASPTFGQPLYFGITGNSGTVQVHPSRVLVFTGEPVPRTPQISWQDSFWGDSALDAIDDAVQNATTASDGFASLIDEAKVDVFRFDGLIEQLAVGAEGEAALTARINTMTGAKSTHRAVILDKNDEWEQRQINWSGMPEIIRAYYALVAGAADIPATRLLGKSPDGMNATGDGDLKNYWSSIKSRQDMHLRPILDQLDALIMPDLGVSGDAYWEFAPLDTPSSKELAEIDKMQAETAGLYATNALVPTDALERAVQNRMVEGGQWPGLEDALIEFPDVGGDGTDPSALVMAAKGGDPVISAAAGGGNGNPTSANDAAPRTLYVSRKVVNVAEIKAWAKAQGLPALQGDLHVTITHSRQPLDWMKVDGDWNSGGDGTLEIAPGGVRIVEALGDRTAVLLFTSSQLSWRHEQIIRAGASYDFPEYQPHISLTGEPVDLTNVVPYRGKIVLGPEIFEELKGAE